MVCKRLLGIVFFCLMLSGSLFSQEKTGLSFQDRMSVKTNAFEWLVTIPNLGVECDLFRLELEREDGILLCTDGLSNLLDEQEILFEVVHGEQRENCCQRLLDIALNRGAPDNVTCLLLQA